jgi:hypothetical protein
MDERLELFLEKAARAKNWEDEESASYDLATLREEFHRRLYGTGQKAAAEEPQNVDSARKR